ncbi:MAG: tRNA lysidine(34) synthetase TilS [Crenarchaeota archaeon]|nr:tRNA lysidine(34) synthetase TilS [Thermoproteota archaeon]
MIISKSFNKYFENLFINDKKIAVAVSGGVDSLSLVILANEYFSKINAKIIGITVDHKLRSSSTDEAIYINKLLKDYNIEHHILTWHRKIPGINVNEDMARNARYSLIEEFCEKHNIETIMVGHHIQDQAENFLIRLFRGSGIKGLSSIQKISKRNNITIVRPFLDEKKENLKNFLEENHIKWIEDESNSDEKYLRNKIRNFINSFEDKDLIVKRINSAVNTFQIANDIIEENIEELEKNKTFSENEINLDKFINLDKELQLRILSKILKKTSGKNSELRAEKLERLLELIKNNQIKNYELNHCRFKHNIKKNTIEISKSFE